MCMQVKYLCRHTVGIINVEVEQDTDTGRQVAMAAR